MKSDELLVEALEIEVWEQFFSLRILRAIFIFPGADIFFYPRVQNLA